MKILMVFATDGEAEIVRGIGVNSDCLNGFVYNGIEISVLVTGVGGISTAWSVQKWLCSNPRPDLAINAGIAGSFNTGYPPGTVVMPVTDCFADLGIEKGGSFFTLAEAGFADPDESPFRHGLLHATGDYVKLASELVVSVNAVTVNTTTGSGVAIERLKNKFNPDIETMEGATFFYICARENIPFLALRAISNMVEPIRKNEWEIPLALRNLRGKVVEILNILG